MLPGGTNKNIVGPLSLDIGRGDIGRGDIGRGDIGRGDIGRGDIGRGGGDLDVGGATETRDTIQELSVETASSDGGPLALDVPCAGNHTEGDVSASGRSSAAVRSMP